LFKKKAACPESFDEDEEEPREISEAERDTALALWEDIMTQENEETQHIIQMYEQSQGLGEDSPRKPRGKIIEENAMKERALGEFDRNRRNSEELIFGDGSYIDSMIERLVSSWESTNFKGNQ
jgi:hypothetical protein